MMTFLQKTGGIFALSGAALIWGLAFAAQRQGMDVLTPDMFLAVRSWIGCAVLAPVIWLLDRIQRAPCSLCGKASGKNARKSLLIGGISCGGVLFLASILQQIGLVYSSAGKGGFLTALYIVIVPILGALFGKKIRLVHWIAVAVVLVGSFLLCGPLTGIDKGDLFLIGCGFCYAGHILVIDHFVADVDCVRLSFLQFLVTAILATATTFLRGETWSCAALCRAAGALLFCGIGSSGIAYTLQIVGQKYVHPVAATLLMSLESVFSVIGGWLILGEVLMPREMAGCALIFAAVILAQLPAKTPKTPQDFGKNLKNP